MSKNNLVSDQHVRADMALSTPGNIINISGCKNHRKGPGRSGRELDSKLPGLHDMVLCYGCRLDSIPFGNSVRKLFMFKSWQWVFRLGLLPESIRYAVITVLAVYFNTPKYFNTPSKL